MAEAEQDKSERATPFKLQRARENGSVAKGSDLGFFASTAAFLGIFWTMGLGTSQEIAKAVRYDFVSSTTLADDSAALMAATSSLFMSAVRPLFFMAATVFVVVLLFEVLQTGVVFSAQPLKPDFSRLNPATGLKRLFTLRLLIETVKNVLKISFYTISGYLIIRHAFDSDMASVQDADALAALMSRMMLELLATFVGVALFFAILDQIIARRDFAKKMAMSRREVRREARDREGDPRLKRRRKQLHAEFSKLSQSVRNLKGADVVITNPEHIAIALRYDRRTMQAPRIVSMGMNWVAQHLKYLALLYGVPVIENRALARALYNRTALNKQIPDHCYQPVADIYNALRLKAVAKSEVK